MVITRELTEAARASTAIGIELGECVTEIGEGAFSGYTNLGDFDLPESVIRIDRSAFKASSITSIDLPSGLTSIGASAFENCNRLNTVDIPRSVTAIENSAFYGCNTLSRVYIERITPPTAGTNVFDGSPCLIYVPQDTYDLYVQVWSNYADKIIGRGSSYKSILRYYDNAVVVACNDSTVLEMSEISKNRGSILSAEIGQCTESIGASAFTSCISMRSVTMPSGLASIGSYAFSGCTSLGSIDIPNGVTSIGDGAFRGCSSVESVSIPSGVTSIGSSVFSSCSGLSSVTLNDSITSIGISAFERCSALSGITLPNSLTSIGSSAFRYCNHLESVSIPSGVTSIGGNAFASCSRLESVYVYAETPPSLGTNAFNAVNSGCRIYVPFDSIPSYREAWSQYENILRVMPE